MPNLSTYIIAKIIEIAIPQLKTKNIKKLKKKNEFGEMK